MSQESENLQWRIRQSLGEFNDDTTPVVLLCYNLSGRLKAALSQQSAVTDDMRYAVRFAPSSAHWSERLLELFGPDARKGIDALEAQLREALSQQEAEPVEKTFGEGIDVSYQDLFSQWQAEHELQLKTEKPAPLPQPDLYKCRNCEWQGRDLNMHEGLCSDLCMETLPQLVASAPQDDEEFYRVYNRLFSRRGADTKHMAECEEVWNAGHKWLEFNEHTKEILGRPNFACAGIANLLRAGGQTIPRKAEEEQAAVIYWMLSIYQKHGADWKKEAENDLAMLAASQQEGV